MFKLPLFGGLFAGLKKAQAVRCGICAPQRLPGTGGNGFAEDVGLLPQAGAGKEVVLETGAGGLLEVEVGEVELHCGTRVLVGEINAGDAFVIGGEGEGNTGCSIGRKRVPGGGDSEDDIVRREIDLNHDVTIG